MFTPIMACTPQQQAQSERTQHVARAGPGCTNLDLKTKKNEPPQTPKTALRKRGGRRRAVLLGVT